MTTGTVPPSHVRTSNELLAFAPTMFEEYPLWLASMTRRQLDTVWLAALTESKLIQNASQSILLAVLDVVRGSYRQQIDHNESSRRVEIAKYRRSVRNLYDSGRTHLSQMEDAYLQNGCCALRTDRVWPDKDTRRSAIRSIRPVPGWMFCKGVKIGRRENSVYAIFQGDLPAILNAHDEMESTTTSTAA